MIYIEKFNFRDIVLRLAIPLRFIARPASWEIEARYKNISRSI
jgi:hypothetical protein